MKKIIAIFMMFLSMSLVSGCGSESPTEIVNNYFTEIKKGENADIANYFLDGVESTVSTNEHEDNVKEDVEIEEAMKIYVSKLDAKVLSESVDGDSATVEVEVTGLNFSNMILEILGESLSSVFSGNEMTDEDMSSSLLDKVKNGKVDTRTGTITLSKVDKEWKMNTEDESFMGLVFGKANTTNSVK